MHRIPVFRIPVSGSVYRSFDINRISVFHSSVRSIMISCQFSGSGWCISSTLYPPRLPTPLTFIRPSCTRACSKKVTRPSASFGARSGSGKNPSMVLRAAAENTHCGLRQLHAFHNPLRLVAPSGNSTVWLPVAAKISRARKPSSVYTSMASRGPSALWCTFAVASCLCIHFSFSSFSSSSLARGGRGFSGRASSVFFFISPPPQKKSSSRIARPLDGFGSFSGSTAGSASGSGVSASLSSGRPSCGSNSSMP